jgi:hypothetical protein
VFVGVELGVGSGVELDVGSGVELDVGSGVDVADGVGVGVGAGSASAGTAAASERLPAIETAARAAKNFFMVFGFSLGGREFRVRAQRHGDSPQYGDDRRGTIGDRHQGWGMSPGSVARAPEVLTNDSAI